ncbi:MAG: Flp pilus assembly protein CpaB [Bacillota bacterium]|nr:Flp pilus assembly protein CpaB [Bacillota bacterium]
MARGSLLRYLLLPALVGLLVTVAVYKYLPVPETQAAPMETVQVVVAKRPIPARTLLTSEDVTVKEFPRDFLPKGAVTDVADAVGKMTVAPLAEEEVILKGHLAGPDVKLQLSFHIPKGYRAMSFGVSETTGVAGFVEPGDRVDIIWTLAHDNQGFPEPKPRSQIVVENALVLAVGQDPTVRTKDGRGQLEGYTSLTLALTPDEALQVALAGEEGTLRFVLRAAGDEGKAGKKVNTVGDLQPR